MMRTALTCLLLAIPGAPLSAADGDIDPAFGFFGVTLAESAFFDYAEDVAVDADGRVVVAFSAIDPSLGIYRVGLARFTSAGALDSTFDFDGVRVIDVAVDGMDGGTPRAVRVLADGRILAAGIAFDAADANAGMLLRLLANGALDPSFGGDGIVFYAPGVEEHSFLDLGIAPTGQIVVSGIRYPTAGFDRWTTIVRFTAAGVPEAYFETNLFPAISEFPAGLVVESATRQVVAVMGNGSTPETRVLRVVAGALDPTFGGDGVVDIVGLQDTEMIRVARTENGRYVVASDYGSSATLTWLLANGAVDPATCTAAPFCSYTALGGMRDLALQTDGKALVVGTVNAASADLLVGRLLATGAVDTTFGSAGFRAIDCSPGASTTSDSGTAVALSSGRAVVVGRRTNGTDPDAVCVARLLSNLIFRNGFEGGDASIWALP